MFGKIKNLLNYKDINYNQIEFMFRVSKIQQTELFVKWVEFGQKKQSVGLCFNDMGFRVYSQNEEDGLLLYIFSQIGFKKKTLIDMAFASPENANSTNLICNWGFHGLLVEGGDMSSARMFFEKNKDTYIYPPICLQKWISVENINEICVENGFKGEIDLFLLDIDGVDYWIWEALTAVKPRVVVVEYQDIWGLESKTVPYKEDFNRYDYHEDYFGASLPAFVKLARKKGYRLIGRNNYCYNAFFLRNDIGEDAFPEITAEECLTHPKVEDGIRNRLVKVREMPWVDV